MNDLLTLPIRPELPLDNILGYTVFAFLFTLALVPNFLSFLQRNKLGKQLRVETMDGREASIFRMLHQSKSGTPTMGGLLIWGSIVCTVLISRVLSYFGTVDHSLFQRGQVYLPLFILLSMGILGAIDDYLNIAGSNEDLWKKQLRAIKWFFSVATFILGCTGLLVAFQGLEYLLVAVSNPLVAFALYIFALAYLGAMTAVIDDIVKCLSRNSYKKGGISATSKFITLLVITLLGALWFYYRLDYNSIHVPYVGDFKLGIWYVPVFMFIMMGTANAVNVTDGLDGLAAGLLAIAFAAFGILAYMQGLVVLAGFCGVCVGAIAAFLWHNVPPALFFMGDTGSLALGGTLAVMALMIDQALVLPLIGFIFVIEMLSVLIQLASKRFRGGKKVFLAAPIHHHFEALNWGESKVTMRFWIVGLFMAFLGIIVGIAG